VPGENLSIGKNYTIDPMLLTGVEIYFCQPCPNHPFQIDILKV
jgi:hypothetical protein